MKVQIEENLEIDKVTGIKEPSMYSIVMFNDDITTMEFVVNVLETIFYKTSEDARTIMLDIHFNGSGVAGTFTYDIAITKKIIVDQMSQKRGFPLKLIVNEAI